MSVFVLGGGEQAHLVQYGRSPLPGHQSGVLVLSVGHLGGDNHQLWARTRLIEGVILVIDNMDIRGCEHSQQPGLNLRARAKGLR